MKRVNVYTIRMVKEGSIPYGERVSSASDTIPLYRSFCGEGELDREHMLVVGVDNKNRPIMVNEAAVGSLTAAIVHPREIFKPVILGNCAGFLLIHNHPSGDPEPSREDIEITQRIREGAQLLGIRFLDHIIIGEGTRYVSFAERGLLP